MTDVLVLCYHAVSETWRAALSVTPDEFERQLSLLHRQGYMGVTVERALTDPPGRRVLAVTFDDAYRSVLELARPILESFGMVASVYAVTGWPGRPGPMSWPGIDQWIGGPHEHELACMGWGELRELADGGWEVGSHTRSHPRLTDLDGASLDDELAASRADCERALGRPCESIAYPYGAVDERVVEAAGRAGYSFGLTLPRTLHTPRPLHWPRVGIYHVDSGWRFRAKTSPAVRRIRGSTAWDSVDGARRRLAGARGG